MFRNFRSSVAVTALTASVVFVNAHSAYAQNDLRSAATELAKTLNSDEDVAKLKDQRIVIAEFENINGKGDAVPRILQEMLTTEFIKQKRFKVVERSQLTKALAELKFTLSDLSDPNKGKQLGKLVGASYIVVGSLSDLGDGTTNVEARIVALEQGENVCAADTTIKNQNAAPLTNTPASSGAAFDIPSPNATFVPAKTKPVPLLDTKAASKSVGTWLDSPPDFGLIGLSNFFTEWREPLSIKDVTNFAVGDVYGDQTRSVVTFSQGTTDNEDRSRLQVLQWKDNKLKKLWKSINLGEDGFTLPAFLSVLPVDDHPTLILGRSLGQSLCFFWDTSTFKNVQSADIYTTFKVKGIISEKPFKFVNENDGQWLSIKSLANDGSSLHAEQVRGLDVRRENNEVLAVANVDNEPNSEIVFLDRWKGTMSIRTTDGKEKATLDDFAKTKDLLSNLVVRTWKVANSSTPYIIVTENVVGDAPDAGGYFQLIQFNGRSYERVWKSKRFGDEVVDIQVGAVKPGEVPSLLILSRTKDRYELTKIAAK